MIVSLPYFLTFIMAIFIFIEFIALCSKLYYGIGERLFAIVLFIAFLTYSVVSMSGKNQEENKTRQIIAIIVCVCSFLSFIILFWDIEAVNMRYESIRPRWMNDFDGLDPEQFQNLLLEFRTKYHLNELWEKSGKSFNDISNEQNTSNGLLFVNAVI